MTQSNEKNISKTQELLRLSDNRYNLIFINLLIAFLYSCISHVNWLLFQKGGILPMPVWPASAIAMTGALIFDWKAAPGIAIGTILANSLSLGVSWHMSFGIAIMNTIGPVWAAIMIKKSASRIDPFKNLRDTFIFLLYGVILMPLLTATGGMASKWFCGTIALPDIPLAWIRWWIAHSSGTLLFTPVLLGWIFNKKFSFTKENLRFLLISFITIMFTVFLFFILKKDRIPLPDLPFILIVPMAWVALHFSIRETMTLFTAVILTSMTGTVTGAGNPFGSSMPLVSLGFMSVSYSLTLLILGVLTEERRQIEETLKKSEDKFFKVFQCSPDAISITGMKDGKIVDINEGFSHLTGYCRDEVLGKTTPDLNIWVSREDRENIIAILHKNNMLRDHEVPIRSKTGKILTCLFSAEIISLNDEDHIISTAKDITESRKDRKALEESEEKFRTLFENITEGVALHKIISDTSGHPVDYVITEINPAYETHTGLKKKDVEGKASTEAYRTENPPYFEEFKKVAASRIPYKFEVFFPPMEKHFVISAVSPREGYFATVFEDITERKKQEEDLKQKNEELTRFIYTVSHDLKSPLVTIKAFTGYLNIDIEKEDKKALEKDIGHIQKAADRMGVLLDELLELSRIGRKDKEKTEIPLQTVVKSALDMVAGRIDKGNVKVSVTEEEVILYGETQRLTQLYQNLIDNSVKFMGNQAEPLVEIGFNREGKDIILFVRDNGCGIDGRYSHKLFGLFEKLDPHTEGTGIGLALIKRIVEVHNGRIWFSSGGVGQGTTFYFTLEHTKFMTGKV